MRYLESRPDRSALAAEPYGPRDARASTRRCSTSRAEERDEIIRVLAEDESEAVGSMGDDTPMPVLSQQVRSLYDYFRQQFAQVTNPPIDPLREAHRDVAADRRSGRSATSSSPRRDTRVQIVLNSPVLSQRKLRQIVALAIEGVPNEFIDLQYDPAARGSRRRCGACAREAESAVREGKLVLLLSRPLSGQGTSCPIHALLATGAVHQHLVAAGLRCNCNMLVETGTARDPHHFACLIGYGATAVYPYMAYQTLFDMMRNGEIKLRAAARAWSSVAATASGIRKGLLKIMSKMGISTIASYRSAQLFEIVGLGDEVVRAVLRRHARAASRARTSTIWRTTSSSWRKRAWNPMRAGRAGRPAQVRARRRIPHVQPGRDRDAAGGGA